MGRLDRAYLSLFRECPLLLPLAFVAGASQLAFALLNVYALPLYLTEHLGLSGKVVGTASATFLLCETLLKIPMGRLSDRIGRKVLVVLGPLLIAANPLFIAALPLKLWRLLFALRAADGIGAAAVWPPLYALVGDVTTPRRRTAAMSVINTVYMGAIGGAAVVGSFVTALAGDDRATLYLVPVLFVAAAAVGQIAIPKRRRADRTADEAVTSGGEAGARRAGSMLLVLLLTFLMTMSVLITASFLVLYLRTVLHLDAMGIARLLAILGVPVLVLGIPLGHLAGRVGTSRVIRVVLPFCCLLVWLLPSCRSVASFTLVAIPLLLGQVLVAPAWLSQVATLAPASRRGGVMGAVATAEGVGAVVGPLVGGVLWDIAPGFIFYGAAAGLGLAAVTALIGLRGGPGGGGGQPEAAAEAVCAA